MPIYTPKASERDVIRVAKDALKWAAGQAHDLIIFDTAGRQEVDDTLIEELRKLSKYIKPREALLVADAATGQQAVRVAQKFDEAVGLTGIILTKLDGDARGGAALSMRAVTGKSIKYVGEGEKLDMLTNFVPSRMADRILGMGDIVGLVEKAAQNIDEKSAMNAMNRMMSGEFNFNDFLSQMRMMQNLGPLEGLLGLLPGFGKLKKQLPDGALDPKKIKHMEAIVLSMTPAERCNVKLLIPARRRRIARGSGRSEIEVNRLIKNFKDMQSMMTGKGKMGGMMKAMQKMGAGGANGAKGQMPDMSKLPQMPEGMPDLSALMGGKGMPKLPKGKGGKGGKNPFKGLFGG